MNHIEQKPLSIMGLGPGLRERGLFGRKDKGPKKEIVKMKIPGDINRQFAERILSDSSALVGETGMGDTEYAKIYGYEMDEFGEIGSTVDTGIIRGGEHETTSEHTIGPLTDLLLSTAGNIIPIVFHHSHTKSGLWVPSPRDLETWVRGEQMIDVDYGRGSWRVVAGSAYLPVLHEGRA